MSYGRQHLAQDDDYSWTPQEFEIPREFPGQTPDVSWSGYGTPSIDWNKPGGVQITSTPSENYPYTTLPAKSSDWWSGITGALVPISTAAASIIRAITGQPLPPGSMYDPKTGRYISPPTATSGIQSLLIPGLLIGGGILLVTKLRKK